MIQALTESLEKNCKYPFVSNDNFNRHFFAIYVRNLVTKLISASLELPESSSVKASAGNGFWAKVPGIAIFNKLVTESVQSGFYCVSFAPTSVAFTLLSIKE
ncbi:MULTISPECIES: MrcB family domain-containing protein [unclassified Microcoleus]|uniref:MrcB family domain-containing protein n=1 Tax=unclassified Microcoleus TaxID=2642155 RepID=UPI0040409368